MGMRCGNEADTVVAMCVDIITHSAEVAQNQSNNIVVVVVVVSGTDE